MSLRRLLLGRWDHWTILLHSLVDVLVFTYVIILALLVASQIYLTVVTWGKVHQIQNVTETWVDKVFNKPEWREVFHVVEVSMECCGSHGASSYKALGQELPPSCCKEPVPVEKSSVFTCRSGDAFIGCTEVVPPYIQKLANYAGSSIFYVMGVEVIAIMAASHLFRAISPS